jgi:hypothetical protein
MASDIGEEFGTANLTQDQSHTVLLQTTGREARGRVGLGAFKETQFA